MLYNAGDVSPLAVRQTYAGVAGPRNICRLAYKYASQQLTTFGMSGSPVAAFALVAMV